MSRFAKVQQNNREEWKSGDWNRHADFVSRDGLNILRGLLGRWDTPTSTSSGPAGGVLEGLGVTIVDANPPKVRIGAGRALAFDPSVVEAVTDDSQMRLVENRAAFDQLLAVPVAGSNAFDLIEVSSTYDVVLNEARRVKDPAGVYVNTPVDKHLRPGRSLTITRVTAALPGTPNLPAFAAGRVPIAAVFVEPVAGATRVVDLRRFLHPLNAHHGFTAPPVVASGTDGLSTTQLYVGACEGWCQGVRFRRNVSQVVNVDDVVESGVVLAANTYFFLYLAMPSPAAYSDPAGLADPATTQRDGMLWLSNVAPGPDGRPSAAFAGNRSPLTAAHVGRNAVYLGAVFVESIGPTVIRLFQKGADGWVRQHARAADFINLPAVLASQTIALRPNAGLGFDLVPPTAQSALLEFLYTPGGAGGAVDFTVNAGAAVLPGGHQPRSVRFDGVVGVGESRSVETILSDATRRFRLTINAADAADSAAAYVHGYLEGWSAGV